MRVRNTTAKAIYASGRRLKTARPSPRKPIAKWPNTADNGGLRIAWMALLDTLAAQGKTIDDKIDGYTEAQRYFLGFGQVWCQNQTEKSARQSALTDPHSPGRWRTNGSVQNFDEFGKAFGCTKGQPMYPANSCRVW